jgi:hypothetical protein
VVENVFGIVKKILKEILGKTKMDITLVPNILHVIVFYTTWFLVGKNWTFKLRLLQVLELETTQDIQKNISTPNAKVHVGFEGLEHSSEQHKKQLKIYLITQQTYDI